MKIYILVIVCLLVGCSHKEEVSPKLVSPNDVFGLKYQNKTALKVEDTKINLELSDIIDYRCIHRDIVCVWGGYISLTFTLEDGQKVNLSVIGGTLESPTATESNKVKVNIKGTVYLFHVEKVEVKNPDKISIRATPKENYTAWLKISKV